MLLFDSVVVVGSDIEIRGRYFTETGLLVFDVDVQDILPVDPEIARLLGENLKKNTAILCQKVSRPVLLDSISALFLCP